MALLQFFRKVLATLPWLIAPTVIGGIFWGLFGLACGFVVGLIFVMGAALGGANIPTDAFGARLMPLGELLELPDIVDFYAERAGIPPPSLYLVDLKEPNVLVWASGNGHKGYARIGVPRNIFKLLTVPEVEALIALAVARIASGEAAVQSFAAGIAGLVLYPVFSKFVNARLGIFTQDLDTGLTPIGAGLLVLLAPACRLTIMAAIPDGALEWCDDYATRLLDDPESLATVLYRLVAAGPDQGTGALRGYNPGILPMFLASPFDKLHVVADISPWPVRVVSMIGSAGPTTTTRGQRLQEKAASGASGEIVRDTRHGPE